MNGGFSRIGCHEQYENALSCELKANVRPREAISQVQINNGEIGLHKTSEVECCAPLGRRTHDMVAQTLDHSLDVHCNESFVLNEQQFQDGHAFSGPSSHT